MEDWKFLIGNDLFRGLTELNHFFHHFKYSVENRNAKSTEESGNEFLEIQFGVLEALCVSHIRQMKANAQASNKKLEDKNKEENQNEGERIKR